ncbi:Nn.00g025340.m01.CDS01 [Neocucurbitaria sp. VM-36]
MSKRKRGPRKKQPPKPFRDLLKKAKAERELQAALEEESDDEILSSVESDHYSEEFREPKRWQALEEELSTLQTQLDEDEREVTWSPSPEREADVMDAQPSFEENDEAPEAVEEEDESIVEDHDGADSPMQPFGDYCIVICRLSSPKYEPQKSGMNLQQRREAHNQRRRDEGIELGRRLGANCPTPIMFREIFATCHERGCMERTSWSATAEPSSMVMDIRGWFRRPIMQGQKVTVLVRAVDGVTCHDNSFKSFLEMMKAAGVVAQLIFQYNKVYDQIRPLHLRNFKGLGGTADFMAADFLAHLDGTQNHPAVARILQIWQQIEQEKSEQLGIQDRNGLLAADAAGPIQGNHAR